MEYRGKRFTIVQGIGPDSWKWAVYLDEKTVKSGEAKTRASAQTRAIWAIDKALALQNPRASVRYRNEQCNFPHALVLKQTGEFRVAADHRTSLIGRNARSDEGPDFWSGPRCLVALFNRGP